MENNAITEHLRHYHNLRSKSSRDVLVQIMKNTLFLNFNNFLTHVESIVL